MAVLQLRTGFSVCKVPGGKYMGFISFSPVSYQRSLTPEIYRTFGEGNDCFIYLWIIPLCNTFPKCKKVQTGCGYVKDPWSNEHISLFKRQISTGWCFVLAQLYGWHRHRQTFRLFFMLLGYWHTKKQDEGRKIQLVCNSSFTSAVKEECINIWKDSF